MRESFLDEVRAAVRKARAEGWRVRPLVFRASILRECCALAAYAGPDRVPPHAGYTQMAKLLNMKPSQVEDFAGGFDGTPYGNMWRRVFYKAGATIRREIEEGRL